MKKVTAGREALGEFAPKFAEMNDDILFGRVWAGEELSQKTRSIVTVVALVSSGISDSSLEFHLKKAKSNGVSRSEIAEILTQTAFYAGWPKAWAAFRYAKDIWSESTSADDFAANSIFPIGEENKAYEKYFIGKSYLKMLAAGVANVTFEPSCRNNWHTHRADKGGGQILLCVSGSGWYREWGKPPVKLSAGDAVTIPANVKHWHGAAKDCWFSHIAIEVAGENGSTEWQEPVSDEEYAATERIYDENKK